MPLVAFSNALLLILTITFLMLYVNYSSNVILFLATSACYSTNIG